MRILINRKPVDGPYGGGNNFVSAFVKFMTAHGHEVVHELVPGIDVLFIQDPRPDESHVDIRSIAHYKQSFPSARIIQRINECDARKNTEHMDHLLLSCSTVNDVTVFVSDWMKNYFFQKGWQCQNTFVIKNGVDTSVYAPTNNLETSEKTRVVTHHWSNNYLKGFDCYEFLDYLASKHPNIEFTYIGRHRNSFVNTKIVPPCSGKELAEQLRGHDIYISGSRNDPGPNHILESIASGIPTYAHAEGGGAVEFTGPRHVFRNLIELEKLILRGNFEKNHVEINDWDYCMEQYLRIISIGI
jgi:glycosyltransferase involved in cell wall biosynthesis